MGHISIQHTIQLGVRGRLVLPAAVRRALGLREGDRLVLRLREDGVIELVGAREVVRESKGLLGRLYPDLKGKALAQELLQDRRREALQE
ncbi:AbrB/MazE/SpoVT family DNA-binding domain-containing protein [Meiothermus rufus]|uniref:AbrB/MazE/SpoVT family DNA-binding domain-containing protein n=1 Tax=Meiothermus rufus TaxID=604332 RepID=UPI00042266EF|nr:AbrB/MazE/SpoVT family DNA-binding domain-containing protein [Meiothermus rufus]